MRTDYMTTDHSFPTFDTRDEAIDKIRETFGRADIEDISSTSAVFKWFEWASDLPSEWPCALWLEVGTIFRDRWVVWRILDGTPSRFTTEDFK